MLDSERELRHFMRKKYQIFISSTYIDLVEERKHVQQAILEMNHFPVGMELFSAASTSQWEIIKQTIDSSDYYVLIIGYRYGSKADDGIGYTEKEFWYAKEKGVPILAFLKKEGLPCKVTDIEAEPENKEKLDQFIEAVKDNREVAYWSSKEELSRKITMSLTKEFDQNKRCGWISLKNISVQDIFFDMTSHERNISKRDQIRFTKRLRLHARTGYSFIAQNGVFYPVIRDALKNGMDFRIVIQNPWSLNSVLFALNGEAFDHKARLQNDTSHTLQYKEAFLLYKKGDWYERFSSCLRGFKRLKEEFGDKINLRLTDMDLSNSILLSDKSLYFEPSDTVMHIGKKSLPLFEVEFDNTSEQYRSCENVFELMWEQGCDYDDYIEKEPFFMDRLKRLIQIRTMI